LLDRPSFVQGLAEYGPIVSLPLGTLCGYRVTHPDLVQEVLQERHCFFPKGSGKDAPGFSLDTVSLRRIVYDHRYLRATWSADKTHRYTQVDLLREQPLQHIVGLRRWIGSFWIADEAYQGDERED
jgi:hypothetical protein